MLQSEQWEDAVGVWTCCGSQEGGGAGHRGRASQPHQGAVQDDQAADAGGQGALVQGQPTESTGELK